MQSLISMKLLASLHYIKLLAPLSGADLICIPYDMITCPINGSMNGGTIRETALSMDGTAYPRMGRFHEWVKTWWPLGLGLLIHLTYILEVL